MMRKKTMVLRILMAPDNSEEAVEVDGLGSGDDA
jgi:hypothetical protein